MKKIILICTAVILCFSSKAQIKDTVGLNLPILDGKIVYEGVVSVPDKSKNDLFQNAQQWFIDFFKSSKDVIQNEDKETGKIIGKGIIFIYDKQFMLNAKLNDLTTIQIDCKDGRYKYRIYDMDITWPANNQEFTATDALNKILGQAKIFNLTKGQCRKILESVSLEMKQTIISLKEAMKKKPDTF